MMADGNNLWTFHLTLVRHGETFENRNKIIQGQKDTLLNEEGKEQVRLVSKRLKQEHFTRVFSSDLQRALKTAEEICTHNLFCKDMKIVKEPLLRERKYGVAEGQSCAEFKRHYQHGKIPAGAETCQEVDKRAVIFFERLLKELNQPTKPLHSEDKLSIGKEVLAHILLVSHGGWIRSMIKYFANNLPSQFPLEKNKLIHRVSPNTGVSTFKLTVHNGEVKNLECLQFYDKSHLN